MGGQAGLDPYVRHAWAPKQRLFVNYRTKDGIKISVPLLYQCPLCGLERVWFDMKPWRTWLFRRDGGEWCPAKRIPSCATGAA